MLGVAPEDVIDFSVCTNPFMPPPDVREIKLDSLNVAQYPDSEASELRQRLSAKLGISRECLLVGSGTTELIRLVAQAYFRPGDNMFTLAPTYGEYEVAAVIAGASVIRQRLQAEEGFMPDLAETADLMRRHRPRAVFICNPNNPTGKYLAPADIDTVLGAMDDSLLVLDEAYVSFVTESWPSVDLIDRGNVVILRSMTKDYGLAGLRLGYSVASPEITASLRRVQPPWSVNAVAQRAGVLALADDGYLADTMTKIGDARRYLAGELTRLGLPPLPSDTHYFLVKVGNAARFRAALLKRGLLVRDGASFGLPEYVRLGTRPLPDCRRLVAAIGELQNGER
jgi:histidinol-phosphate aminotransferase